MGVFRRRIAVFASRKTEQSERKLAGLLRYVAEQGDLAVADFRFVDEELPPSPPWVGRAEGAIVDSSHDEGIFDWMHRGGVPFVCSVGDLCSLPVVTVFTDPRSVARLAAEHFLDLGCREFAFLGRRTCDSSEMLRSALSDELATWGHIVQAYDSPTKFFATSDELSGLAKRALGDGSPPNPAVPKIKELLARRKSRLAVLALNDEIGVTICRIAESLGMAVPEDVAVLGVGNTTVAQIALPPLSSICVDFEKIGNESGRLVHRLMDGKKVTPRHWLIPALGLVARESTVPKLATSETDVDRALAVIRNHACNGITARDVAARLHFALRTFELQFRAEVGHTAAEEIRRVQIERAKSLLANTNLTIVQIAGQIGFQGASYFARFFREHTGMTPSAHRQFAQSLKKALSP